MWGMKAHVNDSWFSWGRQFAGHVLCFFQSTEATGEHWCSHCSLPHTDTQTATSIVSTKGITDIPIRVGEVGQPWATPCYTSKIHSVGRQSTLHSAVVVYILHNPWNWIPTASVPMTVKRKKKRKIIDFPNLVTGDARVCKCRRSRKPSSTKIAYPRYLACAETEWSPKFTATREFLYN